MTLLDYRLGPIRFFSSLIFFESCLSQNLETVLFFKVYPGKPEDDPTWANSTRSTSIFLRKKKTLLLKYYQSSKPCFSLPFVQRQRFFYLFFIFYFLVFGLETTKSIAYQALKHSKKKRKTILKTKKQLSYTPILN